MMRRMSRPNYEAELPALRGVIIGLYKFLREAVGVELQNNDTEDPATYDPLFVQVRVEVHYADNVVTARELGVQFRVLDEDRHGAQLDGAQLDGARNDSTDSEIGRRTIHNGRRRAEWHLLRGLLSEAVQEAARGAVRPVVRL